MAAEIVQSSAQHIDFSPRFVSTPTVVASPADDTETIIARLFMPSNLSSSLGVILHGFAAFTVGTNGVSAALAIRQTDASGSIVKSTGATTAVAADLRSASVLGLDGPTVLGVYVLTLKLVSASAASTVSAVQFIAQVI